MRLQFKYMSKNPFVSDFFNGQVNESRLNSLIKLHPTI